MNTNELFANSPFSTAIIKALDNQQIVTMTEIQEKTIPLIIEGKDVLAQSPTGSGKTLAYVLPLLQQMDPNEDGIQGMILCPTRELALQVEEEIRKLTTYLENIRAISIYGGQSIERQILGLKRRPQIVVGTPGRVIDHLQRHTLKLGSLKTLILDEADEMLRIGFREAIDEILKSITHEKQMLMFSATISEDIREISRLYQKNAVFVESKPVKTAIPNIQQYYVEVKDADKEEILTRLIEEKQYPLVLVFCRTKRRVDALASALIDRGYASEALHGDLSQAQRERVMKQFRQGRLPILVASDVAARGIDIQDIDAVFNYDLPEDDDYYIHRIGRTARAGKSGVSYVFVHHRELFRVKVLERLTKSTIQKMEPPTLKQAQAQQPFSIIHHIQPILENGEYQAYKDVILKSLQTLNEGREEPFHPLDIAAALVTQLMTKKKAPTPLSDDMGDDKPKRYTKSFKESNPELVQRFFINLGMKDDLNKRTFIGFLLNKLGIDMASLHDVFMLDSYSFFEVDKELKDKVIKVFSNEMYKDRQIVVQVAERRDKQGTGQRKETKGFSDRPEKKGFTRSQGERKFGSFERKPRTERKKR